jgi:UDP-glucose 4-epimerase
MAQRGRAVLWGGGIQTRDCVHIINLARAHEAVADAKLRSAYNVGTGENYSFNEAVGLLNDALEINIKPAYEPAPLTNYNYQQRFDVSKLCEATGWEPDRLLLRGLQQVCALYAGDSARPGAD